MITLRPVGGLCNRLRAISTMIELCFEIKQDLEICWQNNDELNADFGDLFVPIQYKDINISFIKSGQHDLKFSDRQMNYLRQKTYNRLLKIYQYFHFDKVLHTSDTLKLLKAGNDFKFLENYKNPYIVSWSKFSSKGVRKDFFQPIPKVQRLIDKQTKNFNKHTIGLHIRRADHATAIKESPLEMFIDKMEENIDKNQETNFFLATDSSDVKQKLNQKFGKKIITQNEKDADRGSKNGMEEAVVDLFALASTKQIYGSSSSSFAITAAEFNNVPYSELKV